VFLVDTNLLSELRKNQPHGAVLSWYRACPAGALFLPSIALYELQAGAEATRKQDIAKAVAIERWIDRIAGGVQILHLDAASARTTAKLMNGKSLELFADAMIAAIAITNSLTVATRNTRDFQTLGVPTVNPFIDLR
jgi:predicted nucleic acid-binding protein